jgi:hypothetical protein
LALGVTGLGEVREREDERDPGRKLIVSLALLSSRWCEPLTLHESGSLTVFDKLATKGASDGFHQKARRF